MLTGLVQNFAVQVVRLHMAFVYTLRKWADASLHKRYTLYYMFKTWIGGIKSG